MDLLLKIPLSEFYKGVLENKTELEEGVLLWQQLRASTI